MSLRSLAAAAAALSWCTFASAAQSPQLPFPGARVPQFVQPLDTLSVAGGTIPVQLGNQPLTIRMCEFRSRVLPAGTFLPGVQPETTVWGYVLGDACPPPGAVRDTYLGPVLVNERGTPTKITWVNELGSAATTGVLAYRYSTDQTLHWADPLNDEANQCAHMGQMGPPAFGSACAQNYAGPVPACPHLHGGEVPSEIDGGPNSWVTSDGTHRGSGYYSAAGAPVNGMVYTYPNLQEAGPAWFHDHTLGATRLNVFSGLAGGYLITDANQNLPPNLPGVAEIVPLIIQDRSFDTTGELYFTAGLDAANTLWALNPDHPYWNPEFVGDVIVVNGKAWPYLDVQPRRHRFLVLNGSNARTYELSFANQGRGRSPSIWVIGTDGGYLDAPAKADPLVIMPGERYEIIVDFGGLPAGTQVLLRNTAKVPYPNGAVVDPRTTGRVLMARVGAAPAGFVDASYDPALGVPLRAGANALVRLVNPAAGTLAVPANVTRQLTLNEVMGMGMQAINPINGLLTKYPGGPLEILVNNTKWDGMSPRTYGDFTAITVNGVTMAYSELPQEGDTEVWEIVNLTADAHPIHLHLVQFQLLNRQVFQVGKYGKAYGAAFPAVPGNAMCPGGVYCPGFGPPLDYYVGNARAVGGNPDVTPYLQGAAVPPRPQEAGWKDTVTTYPGEVTRIAVRWAPTSLPTAATPDQLVYPFDPSGTDANGNAYQTGYVWHCHIIDHEDNEMMRPDVVQPNPLAPAVRDLVRGVDY